MRDEQRFHFEGKRAADTAYTLIVNAPGLDWHKEERRVEVPPLPDQEFCAEGLFYPNPRELLSGRYNIIDGQGCVGTISIEGVAELRGRYGTFSARPGDTYTLDVRVTRIGTKEGEKVDAVDLITERLSKIK